MAWRGPLPLNRTSRVGRGVDLILFSSLVAVRSGQEGGGETPRTRRVESGRERDSRGGLFGIFNGMGSRRGISLRERRIRKRPLPTGAHDDHRVLFRWFGGQVLPPYGAISGSISLSLQYEGSISLTKSRVEFEFKLNRGSAGPTSQEGVILNDHWKVQRHIER